MFVCEYAYIFLGVQIRKREKGGERDQDYIRKKRPDAWDPLVFYSVLQ